MPAQADSSTVDAAARLMAYFYSVDEIAGHCRSNAPTAAPGLPQRYEAWRNANAGKVAQVQRRLREVLAQDLAEQLGDEATPRTIEDEVAANITSTRNDTARLLRRNLERLTEPQLREQCSLLANNLTRQASSLDRHLPAEWTILFVARPAEHADAVGTWSTSPGCTGERWTLRADGREQLTEIDTADAYGYRGEWSVVEGLYRSSGTDVGGNRVRLVGNLQATVNARELRLTITRQGIQAPGSQDTELSDPEQLFTVVYQRCAPNDPIEHPPWPGESVAQPAQERTQHADSEDSPRATGSDDGERDSGVSRRGPRR